MGPLRAVKGTEGDHDEMAVRLRLGELRGADGRHYHDQAEIYYGLSGRGIVYVGDEAVDVYPGVGIYVGARVVHGADALGAEPLRMYWLYGTESTGEAQNWTPVEDIYTEVRGS